MPASEETEDRVRSVEAEPAGLSSPAPANGNALRHGLTATTLLEQVLGREAYDRLSAAIEDELLPTGPVEQALTRRISHHAAALELARQAEWAALREGMRQAHALGAASLARPAANPAAAVATEFDSHTADAAISAAVSSEVLTRIVAYARSHERGLLGALAKLGDLKLQRAATAGDTHCPRRANGPVFGPEGAADDDEQHDGEQHDGERYDGERYDGERYDGERYDGERYDGERFDGERFDDAACETYLMRRMRSARYRCPACGGARGYWLAERRRWECQACRKQAGPRSGTVMAGSPIRLSVWFRAIKLVVRQYDLDLDAFARRLGVRRLATVRAIVAKIRVALASPERNRLLAGLDRFFMGEALVAEEPGAEELGKGPAIPDGKQGA